MRDLIEKPRRFGKLEDSLGGISPRTLTNKLKALEKERFIVRKHFTKPIHSQYQLTKKGAAFNGVVEAMRSYGKKYL